MHRQIIIGNLQIICHRILSQTLTRKRLVFHPTVYRPTLWRVVYLSGRFLQRSKASPARPR